MQRFRFYLLFGISQCINLLFHWKPNTARKQLRRIWLLVLYQRAFDIPSGTGWQLVRLMIMAKWYCAGASTQRADMYLKYVLKTCLQDWSSRRVWSLKNVNRPVVMKTYVLKTSILDVLQPKFNAPFKSSIQVVLSTTAGDLRGHRAHYDVTVIKEFGKMKSECSIENPH